MLLYAGGIWKGDVLIADLEELETMDASEIYSKRLNAKEVIFPNKENLFFQSQMDESKPLEEMARRDGVSKAGLQQAAADSQGSRTCVCANTQPGGGTCRGGRMN